MLRMYYGILIDFNTLGFQEISKWVRLMSVIHIGTYHGFSKLFLSLLSILRDILNWSVLKRR